jgi:hypothetical protein
MRNAPNSLTSEEFHGIDLPNMTPEEVYNKNIFFQTGMSIVTSSCIKSTWKKYID